MLKSALIKDLYADIEWMKQEVRAAREKNGVYLPHDRFIHEEAGKKAIAEKINRMEFELDSKNKQIEELGELNISQQQTWEVYKSWLYSNKEREV